MDDAPARKRLARVATPVFWGLALLGIGAGILLWDAAALSGKRILRGTVIALPIALGHSHGDGHLYGIVARYRDDDGRDATYRADFAISDPGYRVGDAIPLFHSGSAGQIGIAAFSYQFGMAFGICYAGLLILLSPLVGRIGEALFRRAYAPTEPQAP